MTLRELYGKIDGDYDKALSIMRMDKLVDKHIRKLTDSSVIVDVIEAGKDMDPNTLFETSHAMKGVCLNLGLTKLADAAIVISDEFRPGNERTLTDAQVKEKLDEMEALFKKTKDEIQNYAASLI